MQNHYNLVYREEEREMIPLCRAERSGSFPGARLPAAFWPATASGARTRDTLRAKRTTTPTASTTRFRLHVVDRVTEIARERGVKNAQVALAWMLLKPGVTAPIIGASKLQHLEDALMRWYSTHAREIRSLEEPYEPHPVLGHS